MIELLKVFGPSLFPAIAGGVAGICASLLVLSRKDRLERERAFTDRQLKIVETVADSFVRYIIAWRRLIVISSEEEEMLTSEQRERKLKFVNSRNEYRDSLYSSLHQSQIYFEESLFFEVDEFLEWDSKQVAKTLVELPDIEEWWRWEKRIIASMRRSLKIKI